MIALLPLLEQTDSIDFDPFLEMLGSRTTVLDWWLDWFEEACCEFPLALLIHRRATLREIRSVGSAHGVRVFETEHRSRTHAMADAASTLMAPAVALLSFGMAFAPKDLLVAAVNHHRESGNAYTSVKGLPSGSTPEVFSAELLSCLCKLAPGLQRTDPSAALKALLAGRHPKASGLRSEIRALQLDGHERYGFRRCDLPEAVGMSSAFDVAIARRAVERLARPPSDGAATRFRVWKDCVLAERKARREAFRAPSDGPRIGSARSRRGQHTRRVLYVANASGFSGGEQSLCQSAPHVAADRYSQHALIALPGVQAERLREAGVSVTVAGFGFATPSAFNCLFLRGVINQLRPDLVHCNGLVGVPLLQAVLAAGIPLVHHQRVAPFPAYHEQLAWASAIVAVSRFVRDEVLACDVDPEKVHLIYDAVDPAYYRPAHEIVRREARRELGISEDDRVILIVARCVPGKGHETAVDAMATVCKLIRGAHLVLVAEGHDAPDVYELILEKIRASRLEDSVIWLGFQKDIRKIEEAADVAVLCSQREALGICIMEAMATELPVVVSDSGGLPELVEHGVNGEVVPYGDAIALADSLVRLLSNREYALELGRNGRRMTCSRFNARSSAGQMMDLYDRVLAERSIRVPMR
jgi:glycosyltransferase involved in cell wall biosynthesis